MSDTHGKNEVPLVNDERLSALADDCWTKSANHHVAQFNEMVRSMPRSLDWAFSTQDALDADLASAGTILEGSVAQTM